MQMFTHHIQRFAGWLSTGEGKWAVALKGLIRLGCLVQRLTVYSVATVNSHLPIALDNQPANLCTCVSTTMDIRARIGLPQEMLLHKQWNPSIVHLGDIVKCSV